VVVGLIRTPDIVEVFQLVRDWHFDPVELGDLVRCADRRSLGAVAVVAFDVDDQRVVELADVLYRLDHATDFVVGIGRIGGKHLDLADEHPFLVRCERVPLLQQVVWPRRELPVLRNDAEPLLVGKDRVALAFHPLSNRCMSLIFLIHSGVGWCGA
jgi:hypothetical protein